MSGTLAFGCDDCDMYMINASLKPLRYSNAQANLLAEALKAAEALEQTNKLDDQLSNSDTKKGNSLKPIKSEDIADQDVNDADDSEEDTHSTSRPFQYTTVADEESSSSPDEKLDVLMSKLMLMTNRFDRSMFYQ